MKRYPLFRIGANGQSVAFGGLTVLDGGGCLVSPVRPVAWMRDDFASGLFPGVPWFLEDSRPQGFLGRHFARRMACDLGVSSDIDVWDDDAVLTALLRHGDKASGDFVLGQGSLGCLSQPVSDIIPAASRGQRYTDLAVTALSGEAAGSWAGGEQPKFTAVVAEASGNIRHVIVKFSDPLDEDPAARRWADLLVCEHLAGQLMAEQGDSGARTELIWSGARLCLEVTRFDRVGAHGRRGCVTLAAWSDAHDGERDDWASATLRMRQGGWVDSDTQDQVRLRWWFGRMIANTDMHFGNLSFFLDNALPLQLTPNYDMLPMLYRPASSGELVSREFQPPVPIPADVSFWTKAAVWAEMYWQRVVGHVEISAEFRHIAEANAAAISRGRLRFG